MAAADPDSKQPGRSAGASDDPVDAPGRAFERALAEFFVGRGDAERLEAAPEIHFAADSGREDLKEHLSFRLANELYAVSISFIREIIKPVLSTPVPRTDPVILGVLSLRGTIVPVVDLRLLLGLEALPQSRRSRILIVTAGDELVGLLVDEVRHVIRLREEDIEPPPAVFGRSEAEHMIGVGRYEGEMYTLVDLQAVVQLERFIHKASGGLRR